MYFPNGQNSWGYATSKSGTRSILWIFHMGVRSPSTWLPSAAFPDALTGSWIWSGIARIQTSTHMWYRCYRRWLNQICSNVGSFVYFCTHIWCLSTNLQQWIQCLYINKNTLKDSQKMPEQLLSSSSITFPCSSVCSSVKSPALIFTLLQKWISHPLKLRDYTSRRELSPLKCLSTESFGSGKQLLELSIELHQVS